MPERVPPIPDEVMTAISRAAEHSGRLESRGLRIRFHHAPSSQRIEAELLDLTGTRLSRLSGQGVVEMACRAAPPA